MSNRADERGSGFVKDGQTSWEGGVDAGRPPGEIDHNQLGSLLNGTVRGGRVRPRPGWFNQPLIFASTDVATGFQGGYFQTGSFYNDRENPALLASISGRQFRVRLTPTLGTTLITGQVTIPGVGSTVIVPVLSVNNISLSYPNVTIDAYPFTLTAFDPVNVTITVRNDTPVYITVTNGNPLQAGKVIPAIDGTHPAWTVTPFGGTGSTLMDNQADVTVPATLGLPFSLPVMAISGMNPATQVGQPITVSYGSTSYSFTLTSIDTVIIDPPATVAFPPLQLYGVDEITPNTTTQLHDIVTAGRFFTVPGVNASAPLTLSDATRLTMQAPVLTIGGDQNSTTTASTSAIPFTVPPLGQSVVLPVASVTGMTTTLPDFIIACDVPRPFYLIAFNAEYNTITVQNQDATNPSGGQTITAGGLVSFQLNTSDTTTTDNETGGDITIGSPGSVISNFQLTSTAGIGAFVIGKNITIDSYQFVLTGLPGSNQVNLLNMSSANTGKTIYQIGVGHPKVTVTFPKQGTTNLSTAAGFAIPPVGKSVTFPVSDVGQLSIVQPLITVSSFPLTLTAVDNGASTVTCTNYASANAGYFVAAGSTVIYLNPKYILTMVSIDSGSQVHVVNTLAAQVGAIILAGTNVAAQVPDGNDPQVQLAWTLQAEKWWILQDNQSRPVIYDGSRSYRSDTAHNQIPVGNVMCYAMARISVALPDRRSYMVGDDIFASSGTAAENNADSILYFTQTLYLSEGGNFVARVYGAPSESGDILAMKAGAMADTQLGQGPMQVGTPNVLFTVNLPFDRTVWKTTTNPLQTANPIIGPCGQDSTVLVNTDLWYRAQDGLRSYVTAQRQFNGSWGNTSLSNELDDLFQSDTQFNLENGSGVLFDNRLLETVSPVQTPSGIYWQGLAVLDFNLADGMRKKFPPAWEYLWTGLRVLKIITGKVNNVQRCFMFVLNDESFIELWELSTDNTQDGSWASLQYPPADINWSFETRGFSCGNPDQFKRLKYCHIVAPQISGTVQGTVSYKTDEWPCWTAWNDKTPTFTRCAKNADCEPWSGCFPTIYQPQPRRPIKLPEPADVVNAINTRLFRVGYEHQLRCQMVGYAEVSSVRIWCLDEPESLAPERTDEI